jgi:IS30 family transposase
MQRQRRKLTVEERVAIDLRRKDGVRAIARELGRSPSVISTEIGREPGGNYAAGPAQAAAAARRGTPGQAGSPLFAEVAKLLRLSRSRSWGSVWRMERKCRPDYE